MNSSLFRKAEKKQIGIMILIFIGIVPALLFAYWGISNVNIFINKNEYKQGFLIVKDIKCPSIGSESGGECTAYGKVNNIETEVYLGLYPGTGTIYGEEVYADLGKEKYKVFYRPNGKQTRLKKENESKFNAVFYLKRGILELIFPLLVYPFLIFYNKKLSNKLKQIKNEEK